MPYPFAVSGHLLEPPQSSRVHEDAAATDFIAVGSGSVAIREQFSEMFCLLDVATESVLRRVYSYINNAHGSYPF